MDIKLKLQGRKNPNLRAGFFFLTGLLLPGSNGYSQNPDFHIYLAFGQSNMEGSAPIKDLGLDASQVPLLAGELVNSDQGGVNGGFNATIATLPGTLPNSYVISSKGVPDLPDNLHFNSAGYREMGKRYAVRMLSLLPKEPTGTGRGQAVLRYALGEPHLDRMKGTSSLTFELPGPAFVSLKAFTTQGEEFAELAGREFSAGEHTLAVGKGALPKGTYLVTMKADDFSATRKILVSAD